MKISTFTHKGLDIEMTYNKKTLAYTFEKDGEFYGGKVPLEDRSIMGVASATFLLLVNAIETYECLQNNSPKSLES